MARSWLIGSSPDCDIVVSRTAVSGHHCRLVREGDGMVLEDVGSSEGTFVNGAAIHAPMPVTPGDAITLGPATPLPWPAEAIPPGWQILSIGRAPENQFVVNLPMVSGSHARLIWNESTRVAIAEDLGSGNGTAVGAPDRKASRSVVVATDTVYLGTHPVPASELLALLAPPRRPVLTFRGPEMTIGRDLGCDLVVALPMVSGRHARVTRSGSLTLIEDLGSANGTSVNGQPIDRAVAVKPGDVIGLGSYLLELAVEDGAETEVVSPPPVAATSPVVASPSSPAWRWAAVAAALVVVVCLGIVVTVDLLSRARPEVERDTRQRADAVPTPAPVPPRPTPKPEPKPSPPPDPPGPRPAPTIPDAAQKSKPAPPNPPVVYDLKNLTPRNEARLGLELNALIRKHHQIVDIGDFFPRLQAAERQLLDRKKPVDYTYTILDSDEVDAFSHPGGYIYLSWGLFTLVASNEELQFVLAHELAHLENQDAVRGLLAAEAAGPPGTATAQQFYRQIATGYTDEREYEADKRALEKLVALGHTRRECLAFLRRLTGYASERRFPTGHNPPRSGPTDPAQDVANHYCAHPAASKRLERVEDLLDRLKPAAKPAARR